MNKQTGLLASLLFAVIIGALLACGHNKPAATPPPFPSQADIVKRGEYLVSTMGCDDCHSAKRMGAKGPELIPELRLAGYPAGRPVAPYDGKNLQQGYVLMGSDLTSAVVPWGVSFAANITPDETGLAAWTERNFITAMRTGKTKGLENGGWQMTVGR